MTSQSILTVRGPVGGREAELHNLDGLAADLVGDNPGEACWGSRAPSPVSSQSPRGNTEPVAFSQLAYRRADTDEGHAGRPGEIVGRGRSRRRAWRQRGLRRPDRLSR